MSCNCKSCEAIIAVIIGVLAIWPNLLGAVNSRWVIIIAAIVLLVHSFACKHCMMCKQHSGSAMKKKR